MGKTSKLIIKEGVQKLKNLLSRQSTLSGEKRIKCLIYIKEGKFRTRQELACYLGVHIRTMERWLNTYESDGIEVMAINKPKPKKSLFITEDIHNQLEERVNDSSNPFLGYWDAQKWIKEEYGIEIKYHTLRQYMIKHFKTKLKVPRKSHVNKDEQATEAFFKTAPHIQSD